MSSTRSTPGTRSKRLLSIDGGGVAGLIPAESLIAIEQQLDAITGRSAPLCERFDMIGGTSTGAILAAGLCLGLKAEKLRNFYLQRGKEVFTKVFWPLRFWHSYPSGPIERRLIEVLGENTTLGSDKLRTNLLIVAKNVTLGTTWFFTNNRNGRFFRNNAGLALWQIVRASTAAPTFFSPRKILVPGDQGQVNEFEFIDGGVSSYNNPSLQVFLEATNKEYQFGWPTGSDRLLMLSLGTGFSRNEVPAGKASHFNLLDWAGYSVKELLADANLQQNVLMHLVGQPPSVAVESPIAEMEAAGIASGTPDAQALDQMSASLGSNKLLTYQRITVSLTRRRLDGLGLPDIDPVRVHQLDAADQIGNLQRIGAAVAKEQVKMELLQQFFV
jgi:uncharacterized protein